MKNCFFVLLLLSNFSFFPQEIKKDPIVSKATLGFHYGLNNTFGDLAERYGYINQLGGMMGYKTDRNWLWTLNGNFSFGRRIKVGDVLINLRDDQGNINDVNGDVATVLLLNRGMNLALSAGKIFPLTKKNRNSGIMLQLGIGYTQNKLRIETQNHVVPQIELTYKKGYDRYTTGIGLEQFIGYNYSTRNGLLYFYGGFYVQEGLTKNRRDIFFDTPSIPVDKSMRLDGMYGVRLGWIIPINKRKPKEYYLD